MSPDDGSAVTDSELAPCIPRRSHQWRRQALALNLAILTGGVLLLCMTLPSREKTFVPGELSGKHAQILNNTLESQRCGLCHPNSHASGQWEDLATLGGGFWGGGASKTGRSQAEPGNEGGASSGVSSGAQDALCLKCHQGHMPEAHRRTPHDLSAEVLRALAGGDRAPVWHSIGSRLTEPGESVAGSDPHHAELAKTRCADCHVEHRGRGFALKAMADDRCQACHRRKFESFTSGHPEFKNFPAERPRTLAFSHQLHADKHFPQKNRDFDCRQCHLDHSGANSGAVMRSVSFETACAECHGEPIRAATTGGWAVLQLPSIDATAAASGSELEHWPVEARFGFEGAISPVLRALLEADDAAQEALDSLPASGQLIDVPSLGDQRQRMTTSLALAIERLIRETARDGQAAWRERLSTVIRARVGRAPSAQEAALIEAMCAGLPPDLFRQMQSEWFDRAQQLATAQPSPANTEQARSEPTATPLDQAKPERNVARDGQALSLQGIVVERNTDGLLVSDESAEKPFASDDELLLEESSTSDASDLDLLAPPAPDMSALELPQSNGSEQAAEELATPLAGACQLAAGGWYLDRDTLALRYMPSGHADKTLAAWNMWWTLFPTAKQPAVESQSAKSIAQQIPGGCIQCHQLDLAARGVSSQRWSLTAAWQVPQRPHGMKEFTKFDHAPHLSLPAVSDCRYCHVRREASDTLTQLVSLPHDAHRLHAGSEFREMRLTQCVACHRPNGATSGCLQCHNYHVSAPKPSVETQ